jgi:ethanolamine kinase
MQVPETDLKTLYVEANTYALASHLFWSLWGLIQVLYYCQKKKISGTIFSSFFEKKKQGTIFTYFYALFCFLN